MPDLWNTIKLVAKRCDTTIEDVVRYLLKDSFNNIPEVCNTECTQKAKELYGVNVVLISNFFKEFEIEEIESIEFICSEYLEFFIGEALIGDGEYSSDVMIGVYTYSTDYIDTFWEILDAPLAAAENA